MLRPWIGGVLLVVCLYGSASGISDLTIRVEVTALIPPASTNCSGTFIAHDLPFTTTTGSAVIGFYESNGSGLAINDLDDDGRLDIVLANLRGRNMILWNDGISEENGEVTFTPQPLAATQSRAAAAVDVDGDGRLDIVFSQVAAGLALWRNTGNREFSQSTLPGVLKPAYTFAWADVDRDGDLDLATGSYNAELEKKRGSNFLLNNDAGVFYYENRGDTFKATRLTAEAQTLAIWMGDLNDDDHPELLIGNDFLVPDQLWTYAEAEWRPNRMFETTTHSTMSFDRGDLDNSGRLDLFAADMKPYSSAPDVLEIWQRVFDAMLAKALPDDPQHMENTLQMLSYAGNFSNQAADYGVTATGWSWSGKFGDLNNDGWLDLYVVNGMIAKELFPTLPDKALVEENQAFRNQDGTRLTPAPEWGLGSTRSGRGMSMGDLDNDGDLDIVVNNLEAPAQWFENQMCGNSSLEIELRRSDVANTRDLGAMIKLDTGSTTLTRDVRALSGYLSGDPARVHFGFPASDLKKLEVIWSDGQHSILPAPPANTLLKIIR